MSKEERLDLLMQLNLKLDKIIELLGSSKENVEKHGGEMNGYFCN